jgi:hypothetical protein
LITHGIRGHAILPILFENKAWHWPLVKNMVVQDEEKVFNRKLMVPNSLRVHIGQRLAGAFAKARATNARGFTYHVLALHRVQKLRAEFVQKELGGASRVAARAGADHQTARRGGTIKNIFDGHGRDLSVPTS